MSNRVRTTTSDIETYFAFINRRIERLRDPKNKEDRPLTCLVALSLIDAISTVVFPNERVSSRFRRTIAEFGDWPDASRVSLTHLLRYLELNNDVRFDDLRKRFNKLPTYYKYGRLRGISDDPEIICVAELWPDKEYKKMFLDVSLQNLTHSGILYTQRNQLVHEQRDIAMGWDVYEDSTSPFYEEIFCEYGRRIQLVYPTNFVINLCSNISIRAKQYLSTLDRNPYANFSNGHYAYSQLDHTDTITVNYFDSDES